MTAFTKKSIYIIHFTISRSNSIQSNIRWGTKHNCLYGWWVILSPQRREGDQIWRQTTFCQLLNYHLQSLIHGSPFHKASHQKISSAQLCQRKSQHKWRGERRRGGIVVAGHRFNLMAVTGTCSYICTGGGTCSLVSTTVIDLLLFLPKLFAKLPTKWQWKAIDIVLSINFPIPPSQIFGKLQRIELSMEFWKSMLILCW